MGEGSIEIEVMLVSLEEIICVVNPKPYVRFEVFTAVTMKNDVF
jgi:hypothetical protein